MALTVQDIEAGSGIPIQGGAGGYRQTTKDVTFDANYTTGGLSLTASDLGLGPAAAGAQPLFVHAGPNAGTVFEYDYVNFKLKAYRDSGGASAMAEVANATNLSTIKTRVTTIGISV